MPSSPRTPRHSRQSSTAESLTESPNARRYSKSSINDVSTPFRSRITHQDTMDLSILGSGGPGNTSSGMGNLADELADAFSDSGEEYEATEPHEDGDGSKVTRKQVLGRNESRDSADSNGTISGESRPRKDGSLNIPQSLRHGHQRKGSEYDGSEYGSETDFEATGMSTSLITKIDGVESLVRRGTERSGGPTDDVFQRVTEGLRDLGSQSSVEGSASRLITAHTALATHLAHQTRQLHNLTFPLFSPLATSPDLETVDDLVPLLVSLSDSMPRPSTVAYSSLSALHSVTSELVQTLSYLSDTLHMSRQTTATASRRLKSARELVAELRRDEDLREEGERWLDRGNWGERLQKRECAGVCGDVIGGFEDVCNGWRERLLAQADSKA